MPTCFACGSSTPEVFLSLGQTPLANSLLSAGQLDQPEPRFPLEVAFCPACAMVQLTHSVPPQQLFSEYLYFSSFAETMLQHARTIVERLVASRGLGAQSRVVEIASNDGYLLQYYRQRGVPVLGIEPAANIAKVARERGIDTLCEFFGQDLAERLAKDGIRADIIHANNVLAHVPQINGFVRGIATLLKPGGIAVIEAPYLKDLIDHVEFDTIYHEHIFYFSLTALRELFARHELIVHDVERLPIHGGSLRLFISPAAAKVPVSDAVRNLLAGEEKWGVRHAEAYRNFGARVEKLKTDLCALLSDMKRQGRKLAGYGASAKGSTLLNYFGIGRETLDFIADRSTIKQGRFTPGTHLRIVPPEELVARKPDAVLMLAWNFADEILRQQSAYRAQGGKFIIPIPELKVL